MNGIGGGRWLTYFGLAGGGFALDWWTKRKLFAELGPPGAFAAPDNIESIRWIWPGVFGLQTSLNEGALFGLGQGKVWIFAALSIAAAVAIFIWLFPRQGAQDRILLVALSGISGGILGNLYDRLGLWWSPDLAGYPRHAVRDWILFRFRDWTWPNFNVADMLLVGGAGLLILHAWWTPSAPPTGAKAPPPPDASGL